MDLLGMGPVEFLVVLAVALIVVGPRKLPELGRQVGRAIYQFRKATQELSAEFSREFMDVNQTVQDTRSGFTTEIRPLSDLQNSISQGIRSLASLDETPSPGAQPSGNIVSITEAEGYRSRRSLPAAPGAADGSASDAHWATRNVPDSDADPGQAVQYGDAHDGDASPAQTHPAEPGAGQASEPPAARRAQG